MLFKLQAVVDAWPGTLHGTGFPTEAKYLAACLAGDARAIWRRPASQPRPQFQQPICVLDLQL